MSLLLLFRPLGVGGPPPEPEPEPEVVRRGGSSRRKKYQPKHWWEQDERREEEIPYVPPLVVNPVQPIHIIYDEPGLKADAKAEVEYVYKKKRRKKRAMDIAAIIAAMDDD